MDPINFKRSANGEQESEEAFLVNELGLNSFSARYVLFRFSSVTHLLKTMTSQQRQNALGTILGHDVMVSFQISMDAPLSEFRCVLKRRLTGSSHPPESRIRARRRTRQIQLRTSLLAILFRGGFAAVFENQSMIGGWRCI